MDFYEQMVRETNPGVWEQALRTEAPHAAEFYPPHPGIVIYIYVCIL